MDIKLDGKTVLGAINIILFIVVIPLLKYIWSNHLKEDKKWKDEHTIDAKEFRETMSDDIKVERKFTQEIFAKHDKNFGELYDRSKELCNKQIELDGKIKTQTSLCEERHKK